MGKYLVLLFILLSSKAVYCQDKTETLYKVVAIKERNSYYIIHAKRNDSLFKIISRKVDNNDKSQKKIKRGEYYLFEFGDKNFKNHPKRINYMDIYSVQVSENDFIKLTKRFHHKLYETSNLKGLYYVEPDD